ncbi:MAG: AGE family epimerase/isomerase [Kiritimatiellae bacterium]|nr:AGE family epimerase/isomerase [Kiritimatiellia bacterium]
MSEAAGYWKEWSAKCRGDLTGDILPFWLRHGLDRVHGGVYTCLDRDGTLMDPTKSGWFQGRFAFTLAYACNAVERNEEWLAAAKGTLDFIESHLFDGRGRAYFSLAADGTPLRMRRYLFSECFAAIAMGEYAKATGEGVYAEKALDLFKRILRFAGDPAATPPKYEPAFRAIGHSLTMMLVNVALRIKEVCGDAVLDRQIDESVRLIRDCFVHPEFRALLETVGPRGEFIDTMAGRTINPGHAIETSWFLMEVAENRGDGELLKLALTILDWSLDWGWDGEYGGVISFRDCRNFPAQCYEQDMKFWWPQCEAMIAAQYAWSLTKEAKWLEWHRRCREWTYARMPDPEYGEWFGYLHRDGTVAQPAKGNLFKGPFHIPRMMVKAIELEHKERKAT